MFVLGTVLASAGVSVTRAAVGISKETSGRRRRSDDGCFPLGSFIEVDGRMLPIEQATIGMHLLGSQGPSPFMLQGHYDFHTTMDMMEIKTASNHSVIATFDHYFPLTSGMYSVARDMAIGDELWVRQDNSIIASPIVSTSVVTAQGLFNPYTTSGDLFVNGILASGHSSWFLEGLGLQHSSVVSLYQALFSSLSFLYYIRPSAFRCFHNDIAEDQYVLDKIGASKIAYSAVKSLTIGCL
jgi:hypothetical protein